MDRESYISVLKVLTEKYLFGEKDKEETVMGLIEQINFEEIINSKDELLINAYYALKYLEDEYETTISELRYMHECLTKKREFSKDDRNKFITDNSQ